ncbi:MAG: phospho-N-acetylmuramoyl-pentapeptide-transferase [Clostridiaceae bacterium]|jgi:phospho-N-acetylmuramoyl-pentapeptide-transferase|nr:phospho-N-acetylmuramoyl-pentapeptide-transferase [Clostridiaceae bacterium]
MLAVLKNVPSQVIAYFICFVVSLLLGIIMIPLLKRFKFGQIQREDGPQSHKSKEGTPTIGGLIFLLPVFVFGAIYSFFDIRILPLVLVTLGFSLVGFMDDFLKIKRRSNNGLSPRQKMFGLLIVSSIFTWYAVSYVEEARTLIIPFIGHNNPWVLPVIIAIPLCMFFLVGFTNAVNLTDGLDGLAGSVTTIVLLFFTLVTTLNSQWDYIRIFCSMLAGGLLGFLVYNLYPARVFMGDTGSLALGGALAAVAILTGTPIFLAISGIIYVVETLSVMIQVIYFKKTGKRFFLMAPLHHHYEQKGWNEIKIVIIFTIVTIISGILAFILLR